MEVSMRAFLDVLKDTQITTYVSDVDNEASSQLPYWKLLPIFELSTYMLNNNINDSTNPTKIGEKQ